jgi:large subunit ribosomal protein L21
MKDKSAVIKLAGKQHLVSIGSKITTNRLPTEAGETVDVSDVLLVTDGEKVTLGQPQVAGASVSLKVLDNSLGEKVVVSHFRAKARYRRRQGHRQHLTTLEVTSIKA